jgi:hypothetical protein
LPISCTIHTEQYISPEDDDMGPPVGQNLVKKLDKLDGLDLEVSGTMSNADYAPPTEKYYRLLEDIRNSKSGKEKGITINWPAFGYSPISEYGVKGYYVCCFHGCIPVGMVISTRA